MLLHEKFVALGHVLFRYRGWQCIPVLLVLFEERGHFVRIHESPGYEIFCIFIAALGMLVRILTVAFVHDGTSGRNTQAQRAEELNSTGAYSIVRNPLYVGNYLILIGISLLAQNHEVVLINSALFALVYVPIIFTEEDFLLKKFGSDYTIYASRVNCFIPSPLFVRSFRKAARPFSCTMVLRREHDTLFSTMLSLVFVEVLREFGAGGRTALKTPWLVLAGFVSMVWILLKYMKKNDMLSPARG